MRSRFILSMICVGFVLTSPQALNAQSKDSTLTIASVAPTGLVEPIAKYADTTWSRSNSTHNLFRGDTLLWYGTFQDSALTIRATENVSYYDLYMGRRNAYIYSCDEKWGPQGCPYPLENVAFSQPIPFVPFKIADQDGSASDIRSDFSSRLSQLELLLPKGDSTVYTTTHVVVTEEDFDGGRVAFVWGWRNYSNCSSMTTLEGWYSEHEGKLDFESEYSGTYPTCDVTDGLAPWPQAIFRYDGKVWILA